MKVFRVTRLYDISGISGTGHILDGVIFDDGTVVVRWRTKTPSTAIYGSFEEFEAIHIIPHPENNSIEEVIEVIWDSDN